MEPINGKEEWEKTAYTQPLPPIVKPCTGRPKVRRSRKNDIPAQPLDATSLKRHKTSVQCGKCKIWGHNRRTCPSKVRYYYFLFDMFHMLYFYFSLWYVSLVVEQ